MPGQEELSKQAEVLAAGASCSGEEEGTRLPEGKPVQVATPMVASSEAVAAEKERKPRMGLFHHHHHHQGLSRSELGRRGSVGEKGSPSLGASPHHSSTGEEKAKSSWFGLRESKEPTQKPRYMLSEVTLLLCVKEFGCLTPGLGGAGSRLPELQLCMVKWGVLSP